MDGLWVIGRTIASLNYSICLSNPPISLRRLLRKYWAAKKIDRTLSRKFYLVSKGNQFKNKTLLIEAIYKEKAEKWRLRNSEVNKL